MSLDPADRPIPVVPGYVLEELLGRGGSGQVWRGRPRGGGAPVAVKVLVRGDPDRQVREAALLAELDHPHLVRLHRVVRRESRGGAADIALVLDLLPGGSLAALLARHGRLRPGEVVTAVAPVAAALAHAHERGIVHGDLSPGNIVFTAEGRPVLTDLGTARLVGEARRAEMTPPYVDPVVARGGAPGPASDVFGVAAAAFHALTGISPWNAADPEGTLQVAGRGEVPDLALLAPEAPAELVRVVSRGLSVEPHLRGSAAAFALDLRHACRPEPVRLPTHGVPDELLGRSGEGPRTELTHQVPDRRPRAAHAAEVPGRAARLGAILWPHRIAPPGGTAPGPRMVAALRRWAPSLAALLVVAVAVLGAAWLGAGWGGTARTARTAPVVENATVGGVALPERGSLPAGPPATPMVSPATGPGWPPPSDGPPAPVPGGNPAARPPADPDGPPGGSDAGPAVDDLAGWAALIGQLYTRRSSAYAGTDPARLADVYTADSPLLARDRDQVQALRTAGEEVAGFAPVVRRVTAVSGDLDEVVVDLVDEVPAYRVVPADDAGPGGREVTGRAATEVRMTLRRGADGWRIADASRRV